MPLSTDKQLLLCHQMFAHLEKPRIDALLGGCLGAVRRAMTAAGFRVGDDEMSFAGMGAGSGSRSVRSACVEAREGDDTTPALCISARLVVDVGNTGDTPMALTLQMTAHRMRGAAFLVSTPVKEPLNAMVVDSMDAQLTLAGALNRMYGGEQVEAARSADLARDFCAQLNDALVP
jgi:hypothetical protein